MKAKEMKTAKRTNVEDQLETYRGRLDGFGNELKILSEEVNVISRWILQKFGDNLRKKTNVFFQQVHEKEVTLPANVISPFRGGDNFIAEKYDSQLTSGDISSHISIKHENDIGLNETSSICTIEVHDGFLKENFVRYGDKQNKSSKKQTKSKQSSPTEKEYEAKQNTEVTTPKRGRPKKNKQIEDLSDNTVTATCECEICGKLLKDSGSLRQHQVIHKNVKPYPCPECGKCFRRKFHLKTHRLIHAGVKKHQCGYCGKLFLLPKDVIVHERTHTGEKPFSCTTCSKSFNLKSHLVMHIRTHTGEKPYKCDVCDKCFSQSNSLRVHKKVHQKHHNVPSKTVTLQQNGTLKAIKISSSKSNTVYQIANASPSLQKNQQGSRADSTILSSTQTIHSCTVDKISVPVSNLVAYDILPNPHSCSKAQHENLNSQLNASQQNIKIESGNITVIPVDIQGNSTILLSNQGDGQRIQEIIGLPHEISNSEIISLRHINIEQIIGHQNLVISSDKNEGTVNEQSIDQVSSCQNFINGNVSESYFY